MISVSLNPRAKMVKLLLDIYNTRIRKNYKGEEIRIPYEHICPVCDVPYIPYDEDICCPNCGLREAGRYNYVPLVSQALIYNYCNYGSFMPKPGSKPGTQGERVFFLIAEVFEKYRLFKKIAPKQGGREQLFKLFANFNDFAMFVNQNISAKIRWAQNNSNYNKYLALIFSRVIFDMRDKINNDWLERFCVFLPYSS